MNIIELAKECGLSDYRGLIENQTELQAFAQAVIEDYKASLVPVAWMTIYENHIEWSRDSLRELGFKADEIKPLYTLGVNRIDERLGETK